MCSVGALPDSLGGALTWGRAVLAGTSDSAALDAEILLTQVLGCGRATLRAWPERPLAPEPAERYRALIERRRAGWPVAYLTGEREFWSRAFRVGPGVLIPRPETERLVELALERLPPPARAEILDLGTGSGVLALTLAAERPGSTVTATDTSATALGIALDNARRLGLDRVRFVRGHWFDPLPLDARYDLIVSNPPYLPERDPHLARGDLRHEPRTALVSGADGQDALREIISRARARLAAGGWLLLEHGHDQAEAVAGLLGGHGYRDIGVHLDLQRHPRVSVARYA